LFDKEPLDELRHGVDGFLQSLCLPLGDSYKSGNGNSPCLFESWEKYKYCFMREDKLITMFSEKSLEDYL